MLGCFDVLRRVRVPLMLDCVTDLLNRVDVGASGASLGTSGSSEVSEASKSASGTGELSAGCSSSADVSGVCPCEICAVWDLVRWARGLIVRVGRLWGLLP